MQFRCNIDAAILKALQRNTLHEWTVREFKAICGKDELLEHGNKAELFNRVKTHVHQLCVN